MENSIQQIKSQFHSKLATVASTKHLEELRLEFLGKKGILQDLMQQLRAASSEERPRLGRLVNDLKEECQRELEQLQQRLILSEEGMRLAGEKMDVTLPGRKRFQGREHPVALMREQILAIFRDLGFSVQVAPDIDSDYYVFEGLGYPADHPARDMQDTYYVSPSMLLRSHTTNIQLRVMEASSPPIRVVCPGTVYRNETISSRAHVFFHQIDGIYIDKGVAFTELFATMKEFVRRLFGRDVPCRFRPSYFPFTEPSLEVDMECTACQGGGCRLCKHSGWLEWVGAGMVHPEILKNGGLDPEEYSGFAWGLGVERLTMLRYGISDIRHLFENDMRLLSQIS